MHYYDLGLNHQDPLITNRVLLVLAIRQGHRLRHSHVRSLSVLHHFVNSAQAQ